MLLTIAIEEVRTATPRARIVRLGLRGRDFPYAAGQAIWLGAHGQPLRKPYSIANAPEDAAREGVLELLVGVDENGRPGAHLTLQRGAVVDVDGPAGRFVFPEHPKEHRFVFVAGGTGIAPLRAMLRHALQVPGRQIGLLYSARTPTEFAFEEELRALAAAGHIELKQTVTRTVDDSWTGTRGRISRDDLAPLVHDPATLCFVCGPQALVEDMPKLLAELGIAPERIKKEEWG